MDAKTRYRRRIKLQAALARVLEVLCGNAADGIPPDRTTALLAGQVARWLTQWVDDAGVDLPAGDEPDRARYEYLILSKLKDAAKARARRRRKHPPKPPQEPRAGR
ncbi:MAG: hypothetical protein ACJ768_01765 [Gaiellaceae bacterium]